MPPRDATAISFAPGVVLVLGGQSVAGGPIDATEIADLRVLPGSIRLTGSLPAPDLSTVATLLDDGTLLVACGSALTLYFPYPL